MRRKLGKKLAGDPEIFGHVVRCDAGESNVFRRHSFRSQPNILYAPSTEERANAKVVNRTVARSASPTLTSLSRCRAPLPTRRTPLFRPPLPTHRTPLFRRGSSGGCRTPSYTGEDFPIAFHGPPPDGGASRRAP